jgi:hypothetical protein
LVGSELSWSSHFSLISPLAGDQTFHTWAIYRDTSYTNLKNTSIIHTDISNLDKIQVAYVKFVLHLYLPPGFTGS